MTWDGDAPAPPTTDEGVPLCSTEGCGLEATHVAPVPCSGCSVAQEQQDTLDQARAALVAAQGLELAGLEAWSLAQHQLGEAIAAEEVDVAAVQQAEADSTAASSQVMEARAAIKVARAATDRAEVYVAAWTQPHEHAVFSCDLHSEG